MQLGLILAWSVLAAPASSQEGGFGPPKLTGEDAALTDDARLELYMAARAVLDQRYLGPSPYWSPDGSAWGWYSARPSLGGTYRAVSFHRGPLKQGVKDPRFYARRVEYTGRAVSAALDQVLGSTGRTAEGVAGRVRVEISRADEHTCPALKRAFAELERLPAPSLKVLGLNGKGAETVDVRLDGTGVALTLTGVGVFERSAAGRYGRVTYSDNMGPAYDWVMRFERATAACWRPDVSS